MAATTQKSNWGARIGLGALIVACSAVVVALVTLVMGYVSGTEFNPETFERRRFSFYEVPLVRLQVTPLYRDVRNGPVETLVQNQSYVKPTPNAPEKWDLVAIDRGANNTVPTDPLILLHYLEARIDRPTSSGYFWEQWSVDHPAMAKELWPAVARMARLNLYIHLPPLFELARGSSDAVRFDSELHALEEKLLRETAEKLTITAAEVKDSARQTALHDRVQELQGALDNLAKPAVSGPNSAPSPESGDATPPAAVPSEPSSPSSEAAPATPVDPPQDVTPAVSQSAAP